MIQTNRLELVPATKEFVHYILTDRDKAAQLLNVDIPFNWPEKDLLDFLPFFKKILEHDPEELGFGVWLIINKQEQRVIGDAGFKGKPIAEGMIEIGYSILPEYRRNGFAFEAVIHLIEWGFRQKSVKKIIAECYEDNIPSIKVLQKVGMKKLETKDGIIYWEMDPLTFSRKSGELI